MSLNFSGTASYSPNKPKPVSYLFDSGGTGGHPGLPSIVQTPSAHHHRARPFYTHNHQARPLYMAAHHDRARPFYICTSQSILILRNFDQGFEFRILIIVGALIRA